MTNGSDQHAAFASGYRGDIDGLRALAVVAVILYHANFWPFSGGFVGVDVFFVISGFLITAIVQREVAAGRFSIAGFYERRIRRIFPALFFLLIVVTPVTLLVLLPYETLLFGRTLTATALFGANIYFWRTGGYFHPDLERNPLLHTWSLSVEEQFYIFFPLLLLLLLKARRRSIVVAALAAIALASLVLAEWQVRVRPDAVFYLLPTRAWELVLGAILTLARLPAPGPRVARAASYAGLAAIVAPILWYTPDIPFPGLAAVPPCVGAALLLYAGATPGNAVHRAFASAPLGFVGKISYSLYLWHLPLLVLPRIWLDRELTFAESLLAVAFATALATLSWRFVERPFRRTGTLAERPRVLAIGVAASAVFSVVGVALLATHGLPERYSPAVVVADAAQADEPYPPSCVGPNAAGGDGCAAGDFDLLIWGDSHAAHYYAGVAQRAARAGFKTQLQWVGGCPPVLDAEPLTVRVWGNRVLEGAPHRQDNCAPLNAATLAKVAASKRVKAVVLAGAWAFWSEGTDLGTGEQRYLVNTGSDDFSVAESRHVLRDGLARTVAELRGRGLQVLLLGQVPDDARSPSQCMARAFLVDADADAAECGPATAATLDRVGWSSDALRTLAAANGAYFFDAAARLCVAARCIVEADGQPLYRDADHLTQYGSTVVAAGMDAEFFHALRAPAFARAD